MTMHAVAFILRAIHEVRAGILGLSGAIAASAYYATSTLHLPIYFSRKRRRARRRSRFLCARMFGR